MKPLRLFFAVWPPDTVRQRLWQSLAPLREALPAVRWIPSERLHITLRFMGDVSPEHVPRLLSAAEAIGEADPFEVGLAGTATFPRRGPARVYWVGVRGQPLVRLRKGLDLALAREGVEREDRTFKPHLTVGRASKGRRGGDRPRVPVAFAVPELAFTVGAIHLVRSDLLPGGPRYANLHRAILGTGRE